MSFRSNPRTALALLTTLNFLNYVDRYVLPAVQVPIEKEFHVGNAQFGLLTTAFFICYMVAAGPIGWLADRYSRRMIIAAGGIVWSGATLLTALTWDYETLFIRHLIVGIGEASFATIAPAFLSDLYGEEQRGRVLAVFNIALPFGAAVGLMVGGVLGARYGWRAPFYVGAIPGFVVSVLMLLVTEPKRGAQDHVEARPERTHALQLFRNGAFLTASLGIAMLTFAENGIATFMPKFLTEVRHYGMESANVIFGGITAFNGIVPVILGGWLGDRMLRRSDSAHYRLSGMAMGLAIPTMIVAIFVSGPTMWPAMFVTEFVLFLNTGPLNAAIVNSVSAPIRATAIAANIFIIHALGDVPAPYVMGWIADRSSLETAFGCAIIATALSCAILLYGARFAPHLRRNGAPDAAPPSPA